LQTGLTLKPYQAAVAADASAALLYIKFLKKAHYIVIKSKGKLYVQQLCRFQGSGKGVIL